MYYDGGAEDSDDEWFYSSFKRYDDLSMYNVQGSISSMALKGNSKLLLASSRGQHHEILELSVPKKIIAGKDSGLTRDRDFGVLTGGYTTGLVKRILPLQAGVVTSESTGINFYSIPNSLDDTDIIMLKQVIKKDVESYPIADANSVVYYGIDISDVVTYDLSSETSKNISLVPDSTESLSKDINSGAIGDLCSKYGNIYICLNHSGNVLIFDPRKNHLLQKGIYCEPLGGRWTLDVSDSGHYVATFGSNGCLRLYDSRNFNKFLWNKDFKVQEEFKSKSDECICVKLSPHNNLVSVSGIDRNIHISGINEIPKDDNLFIHDGHRDREIQSISTHLWHPEQENLLFSADDTGQLQAWRFKGS
ncbi:WD repeat-containing protein 73-like isoform X1 [Palaemon carinicauda]|uniref:WD repeat-containing protein 73-like isoform X1 n=1 Tax=Palaemon carinicauda TaxID=392227 RepID=UPI0035B5D65D